jgi:hypothetical protein
MRSYHARSDLHYAVDLLDYLASSDTTLKKHIAYLAARADDFVAPSVNWAAITAVANALLKHGRLSNADVRRVVLDSYEDAFRRHLNEVSKN